MVMNFDLNLMKNVKIPKVSASNKLLLTVFKIICNLLEKSELLTSRVTFRVILPSAIWTYRNHLVEPLTTSMVEPRRTFGEPYYVFGR